MPSRRALLAGAAVPFAGALVAGCASLPPDPPALDALACPPVGVDAERVACAWNDEGQPLRVSVGPPRVVGVGRESLDAVPLLIENDADAPLRYRQSSWRIYRNRGFGWRERTLDGLDGVRTVQPGGSHGYGGLDATLNLGATGPTPPGTYVLVVPAALDGERVALVAAFRVGG